MLHNYNMNLDDFLEEGLDEPIVWNIGEEVGIYPVGSDNSSLNSSELTVLKSITKISEQEYKCYAENSNNKNNNFNFIVSPGTKIELAIITAADCMLGCTIEDCLCEVTNVSENSLTFKVIGINR